MNKLLMILLIAAVVIVTGVLVFGSLGANDNSGMSSNTISYNKDSGSSGAEIPKSYVIEITADGFSPAELSVNAGDRVTWINKDSGKHWPASAVHPTHTAYPGANYEEEEGSFQGSKACISEGQTKSGAFDPCHGLAQEESWSFTFTQKGSWGFHDHLNSRNRGKIIVN